MGRFIEIIAHDGHRFSAYRAEPAGKAIAGLVVAPEIFGINSHVRSVADGLASEGYLAIAPALFDRAQRNYETGYAQADIQAGIGVINSLEWDQTMMDVDATIEQAKPAGKVGIVGYCWGGTVAWLAASRSPGLACSVAYYGGGIFGFHWRGAQVPAHAAFRRAGPVPHLRAGTADRCCASVGNRFLLSRRARIQLRSAWFLPCAIRGARPHPHAGVPRQAPSLDAFAARGAIA